MTTVWVIMEWDDYDYDDYDAVAVFSTGEKAAAFIASRPDPRDYFARPMTVDGLLYIVEAYEADEPLPCASCGLLIEQGRVGRLWSDGKRRHERCLVVEGGAS